MDDIEKDAGYFQPIAQMRRLPMVLPKVLEMVESKPIPVKLYLPKNPEHHLRSSLESQSQPQQLQQRPTSAREPRTRDPQLELPPSNAKQTEVSDIQKEKDLLKNEEENEEETKKVNPKKERSWMKKRSGKRNNWSESETSSVQSVASQMSNRPGRNFRATPHSQASSRNTNSELQSRPSTSNERGSSKRERDSVSRSASRKEKVLMDVLVKERKAEHKREAYRHYVKSMINDIYERKQGSGAEDWLHQSVNGDSDIDLSSSLGHRPPRPPSSVTRRIRSSNDIHKRPKQRKNPKRSPSNQREIHHSYEDVSKRAMNRCALHKGRYIHSTASMASNSDSEAENVILIIREEFKRLGFL